MVITVNEYNFNHPHLDFYFYQLLYLNNRIMNNIFIIIQLIVVSPIIILLKSIWRSDGLIFYLC